MSNWYRPASLAEALTIRARERAVPMAGATDLLVRHRKPAGMVAEFDGPVLYIAHLEELTRIEERSDELSIGGAVTYTDLLRHPATPQLLRDAVVEIAAPGLRNVGTLAGNICNASPAADAVCPLYALDAQVELSSPTAVRRLPIEEFVTGPGRTGIGTDELLTAVVIPDRATDVRLYKKVGTRRANALSKLSFAGRAAVGSGVISDIALAFGAVAPTVVRSRELEATMRGSSVAEVVGRLEEILAGYRELLSPIDDQRSTARYRAEVALNLARAFIGDVLAPPGA
ncbi:MAG: FAD binding domain-containing protein [Spirochaetales bacterium]|nr:FAD binding domain-containing protein [Spirochaetales bacterium]